MSIDAAGHAAKARAPQSSSKPQHAPHQKDGPPQSGHASQPIKDAVDAVKAVGSAVGKAAGSMLDGDGTAAKPAKPDKPDSPDKPTHTKGIRKEIPKGDVKFITNQHLHTLLDGPAKKATEQVFNNKHSYVVYPKSGDRLPKGWHANEAVMYDSYDAFKKDAKKGFPKSYDAAVYDNEDWDLLPAKERADPDKYANKFKKLAHRNGLAFVGAPAPAALGDPLTEADAKNADILDVQAQDSQSSPSTYASRARGIAAHARSVNPGVKVVGEISSNPQKLTPSHPGSQASTGEVNTAVKDVTGSDPSGVQGYWPWIFDTHDGNANGEKMVKLLAKAERSHHK